MEQVGINGSSIIYKTIPAGSSAALLPASGARALSSNEAAADIIALAGALQGPVTVTVPPSLFPQNVGTDPQSPLWSGPVALSWIKIFQNNSTGAQPVTISAGGPNTAGFTAAEQGKSKMFYSPDGVNVFAAGPAV